MFNEDLEKALTNANHLALEMGHMYIDIEHLLLAIIDSSECSKVFGISGTDVNQLKSNIKQLITSDAHYNNSHPNSYQLEHTDTFKRVIQRAIFHVQTLGKTHVSTGFVLVAILSETNAKVCHILNDEGVNKVLVNQILIQSDDVEQSFQERSDIDNHYFNEEVKSATPESSIAKYTINLNEQVTQGRIDPLYQRDKELERVTKILCRRRKNNPILVGEPGVGKTAIAEGLAYSIVKGTASDHLRLATVYSLDIGSLLAGTKYRGDFEKRFKAVLKELSSDQNAILFIDEIHSIIGAGAASGGSVDAANLMKPMLSRGQLRCIGATTYQEYKQIFDKDKALSRRFQKVDIVEPTPHQCLVILKQIKSRFEDHHGVHYSQAALKTAVDLSVRYLNDRFLPDKVLDVIDEAGSSKSIEKSKSTKKLMVDARDIEKTISEIARIPKISVSISDKKHLLNLERDLKMTVYGQDEAISSVTTAVKVSKSGLRESTKPIGSFLFVGPSGVGKTELAKQLAHSMNLKLLRFDMSEYMEKHSSSQLIGAPAGYVGFDQGGLLTDAIIKHPYSVLLLDEIEKAHPELLNILLQAMENGQMHDNLGRVASFRHIIIIMTSNSGSSEYDKPCVGFGNQEVPSPGTNQEIKQHFSPEFRNRLDAIVHFKPLAKKSIEAVIDKFLANLEVKLGQQNIELTVTDDVKTYLLKHGYDSKNGARPIERLIERVIKRPLAESLLSSDLRQSKYVNVFVEDGVVVRVYDANKTLFVEKNIQ